MPWSVVVSLGEPIGENAVVNEVLAKSGVLARTGIECQDRFRLGWSCVYDRVRELALELACDVALEPLLLEILDTGLLCAQSCCWVVWAGWYALGLSPWQIVQSGSGTAFSCFSRITSLIHPSPYCWWICAWYLFWDAVTDARLSCFHYRVDRANDSSSRGLAACLVSFRWECLSWEYRFLLQAFGHVAYCLLRRFCRLLKCCECVYILTGWSIRVFASSREGLSRGALSRKVLSCDASSREGLYQVALSRKGLSRGTSVS